MDQVWRKPVVRTLADQVAETIVERIVRGQYRPGQAMPSQRELARRLGVGMSVVREAIQRLQTLRILSSHQGRGTIVETVRWRQLMFEPALGILALERYMLAQIWEARGAIEKETARLAAARATAPELEAMRCILDEAGEGTATYDENRRLNKAFHLAIAEASHNRVLADMLTPLLDIEFGAKRKVFDTALSRRSWQAHRGIYDAILSRDPAAVARAMAGHAAALDAEMEMVKRLRAEDAAQAPVAAEA